MSSVYSSQMLGNQEWGDIEVHAQKPQHGGDIQTFCDKHGFDAEQCIDLSTGISPWAWPVPEIPQEVWQTLPSSTSFEQDLRQSAADYYGCDANALLAVSGSQAAIEQLPFIVKPDAQIAFPFPGYEEHRFAWANAGKRVHCYKNIDELQKLLNSTDIDHAVVINPNNPSTEVASCDDLEDIRHKLHERGGFLIVDEAFADARPKVSLMHLAGKDGLIILRSIGKFFGLAGLRLGFVAAPHSILTSLAPQLGLWSVHSAALWLGAKLLSDKTWAYEQRLRIHESSQALLTLVMQKCPELDWKSSELFVSGTGDSCLAKAFVDKLAAAGIHSRYIHLGTNLALVRLGLPGDSGFKRIKGI